ncbi:hypothetical protein ACFX11_039030 [Malus domestica]
MLLALDLQLSKLKLLLNEIDGNEAAVLRHRAILENEVVVPSQVEESDHGFELFLHCDCETGERADQDEDASGKPYNEGGSSWDFVNRLSQLKTVDIFCTVLPKRPRGRQSFVNMSCAEKGSRPVAFLIHSLAAEAWVPREGRSTEPQQSQNDGDCASEVVCGDIERLERGLV